MLLRRRFRSSVSASGRITAWSTPRMSSGTIPARSPGSARSTSPARDLSNWRSLSAAVGRTRGRTARASTPGSGSSVIGCVSAEPGPDGGRPRRTDQVRRPRGQLEDFIRAVRQAVRDTDTEHQASMARYREHARREAQATTATRPSVPAWQKIRPASTQYWPRPSSSAAVDQTGRASCVPDRTV